MCSDCVMPEVAASSILERTARDGHHRSPASNRAILRVALIP